VSATINYQAFRAAVLQTGSRYTIRRPEDLGDTLIPLHERLATTFPVVYSADLDRLFPSTMPGCIDMTGSNQFLHLRPSVKEARFLPVLSIRCNFAQDPVECRLRIALFTVVENVSEGVPFAAIGFRIELAESDGIGWHNYSHLQLIDKFGNHQLPGIRQVPTTQPAFPLDADLASPAGLMLCLLLSLYGPAGVLPVEKRLQGNPAAPKLRATAPLRQASATSGTRSRTTRRPRGRR